MSFNMHCSPLAVKREPFDSTVAIKLEVLDSPKKSIPAMHHLPSSANDLLKCKKRVNFTKMNYTPTGPQPSVARRNERERNRVKMVNMGFATLRQHVPNGAKNKKMSKVETLRSAVEYIRQLQRLLGTNTENSFTQEQFDSLLQFASTSSDENCYPSPSPSSHTMESSPMESTSNHDQSSSYSNQVSYTQLMGSMYSPASSELCNKLSTYNLTSPSTLMAARTSPCPSVGSDITSSSSPYDNQSLLDTANRQTASVAHEEELFDFSGWF